MKPIFWRGVWLPENEHHLQQLMARQDVRREGLPTYQLRKYQRVMKLVRNSRRLAVDAGAHAGLWSQNMAIDFDNVIAFEPVPEYAICWKRNLEGRENAVLHRAALGAKRGTVSLTASQGISVDTFIADGAVDAEIVVAHNRPMKPLDSYKLADVDLIKIDTEGYEHPIIKGAEQTIRTWKPAIIVEQKPGKAQRYGLGEIEAVELLQSWGATLQCELQGDYILSWD